MWLLQCACPAETFPFSLTAEACSHTHYCIGHRRRQQLRLHAGTCRGSTQRKEIMIRFLCFYYSRVICTPLGVCTSVGATSVSLVKVRQLVRNTTGALSQNEDRILICSVSVAGLLLTTSYDTVSLPFEVCNEMCCFAAQGTSQTERMAVITVLSFSECFPRVQEHSYRNQEKVLVCASSMVTYQCQTNSRGYAVVLRAYDSKPSFQVTLLLPCIHPQHHWKHWKVWLRPCGGPTHSSNFASSLSPVTNIIINLPVQMCHCGNKLSFNRL